MFEGNKYRWDYIPTQEKETGYEDIIQNMNIISVADFCKLSDEEQDEKVAEVIQIIRSRNIFPIYYFNEQGILNEIKKVIAKNNVHFTGDKLVTQASQGLLLLDYLFPNLHFAEAGNMTHNCMYSRFYDDTKSAKCIKRHMKNYSFNNMRTPFFMYGRFFWNTATNFAPIRAKAIYEKFCPKGGVIYDYSCGYGGRMLGALSSKNNYTYIGCEPCTDTYNNLNYLGSQIERVTQRQGSYKIYHQGSEELVLPAKSIDFAFSCPPFYGLERYSDEDTQSVNKFPEYKDWLEYYVRPTIKNAVIALKDDGLYGVDVFDFTWKNKKYHLTRDWRKIAEEEGLIYIKSYPIISRNRKDITDVDNTEHVHIFKKAQ